MALLAGIATAVGGAIGRAIGGSLFFAWAFAFGAIAFVIVGFVVGIRFRLGHRSYVQMMDDEGPALIRLMPILGIPVAILSIPLVIGIGVLVERPDWPHWARSVTLWGTFAWGCAELAVLTLLVYRPPRWLLPRWLLEQDPFAPIQLRTYNRGPVFAVIVFMLFAGMFVAAAIFGALGTRGL